MRGRNPGGMAREPLGRCLDGVVLYDVTMGKRLLRIRSRTQATPFSAAFSPDGNLLAVGYGDEKVRIWEVLKR